MAKKVTVIPAVSQGSILQPQKKLRVCAYARVSTGNRTQAESYATQVEYYTDKIMNNPLWEFAGVYADEGITGTKTKGRNEFNAMIAACESGEIDLILTKSITRFARNTVECIQTIRKLKALGIGISFEKEHMNTLNEESELMMSILASIAQGESEDFSGNNRWAIIKRFENGTYITSSPAYGYRKDQNGELVIEEAEAGIVREIFHAYMNGMGAHVIARILNESGIPRNRKYGQWHSRTIRCIIQNPVYEGNVLCQKTYTERQFPFQKKKNKGQLSQYLTEDAHPPIITHEMAETVRNILDYRTYGENTDENTRYPFTQKIVCGICGKHLRRRILYISPGHERTVWTCPRHVIDMEACTMKEISEDQIKRAFTDMWNKLYTNQGTVLEPLLQDLIRYSEKQQETEEIQKLNEEIQSYSEQLRILNEVMKKGYMDAALFMQRNNLLTCRLTESRRRKTLAAGKQKRTKEISETKQLIGLIEREGYQTEYKDELFEQAIKEVRLSAEHEIGFCLRNGLVLTEKEGGGRDGEIMAHADGIHPDRWED